MQTKSYRLLKWTLMACVTASLATACVVTTDGSGGDDVFDDDGGTGNSTAGTDATSGGGGTTSTAGTGGSAALGGAGAGAGTDSGGTTADYVAGLCDADDASDDEGPTPADLAPAALDADDELPTNECRKCMKQQCTTEWQTCYGSNPTIACGFGEKMGEAGQFQCILGCFETGAMDPMGTADDLLADCSAMCTNQCDDGGNVMVHTSDLIGCANDPDKCQAECFPF